MSIDLQKEFQENQIISDTLTGCFGILKSIEYPEHSHQQSNNIQ